MQLRVAILSLAISACFAAPAWAQPATANSPEPLPVIAVPPGWQVANTVPEISGAKLAGAWSAPPPASPGDNILLAYGNILPDVTLGAVVKQMSTQPMFSGNNLIASHAERLCNGTVDGWMFEINVVAKGTPAISELVLLAGKERLFWANYTRSASEAEDRTARAALNTLCTKAPAGSVPPGGP